MDKNTLYKNIQKLLDSTWKDIPEEDKAKYLEMGRELIEPIKDREILVRKINKKPIDYADTNLEEKHD